MFALRWLAVVAIAVIGIGATWAINNTLISDARQSWEIEATSTAQSLSGTLLGWLEESHAPLSGLAALNENSDGLTEAKFLNAFDGLEARATTFFLEAAALVEQTSNGDIQSWQIKYSTNPDGLLALNKPLAEQSEVLEAVKVAENRLGEIILGPPMAGGDEKPTVSPVALATFNGSSVSVIVGLVDYTALINGLFELHVPKGAGLKITGRFPGLSGPGSQRKVFQQEAAAALYSVPVRTVSAGAELVITWGFDEQFSNGPSEELANVVMIAGLAGVVVITLFFALLLQRDHMIMLRVDNATRELTRKESQLRMALDNMPGAIVVVDNDQNLVLLNEQYKDFYGDADGLAAPGNSMRDILRKEIELGYISGEGGPEEILDQRLATFKSAQAVVFRDTVRGGRIVQVTRKPTADGYTVSVATDISEIVAARRGEKLLREALDSFSDMVILYDKDERVIFTNDRYHEIYPNSPPKGEITDYTMEGLLRRTLEAGQIDQPLASKDPEAWLQQSLAKRRDKAGNQGETTHADGRTYFYHSEWTAEGSMILVQIDITERKRQEIALRRSEEQFRRILEDSPVAVAISLDDKSAQDGIVQFANARFLDMTGYAKTDIGKVRTESFSPRGKPRDEHQAALDAGESFRNREQVITGKNGNELWTLMSISPIEYLDRKAALIWVYDITDRRRVEEELRAAKEQSDKSLAEVRKTHENLRGMLKRSPIGASIARSDTLEIVFANSRLEQMLRFAQGGMLGRHVDEFWVDMASRDEITKEFLAVGHVADREIQLRRSDGTPFWCLGSFLSFDFEGKPSSIAWFVDIDERKKAEDRFKALLESAPDATVIVNSDGDITQSNQQMTELFGYTAEQLLGRKVEMLLPDHLRKQHPAHRDGFFENAHVRPMGMGLELFGKAKNGREFPIEISLSPIETHEGTLVSASVRDITQRKQAENDLRIAKEQAETALAGLKQTQARLVQTEKMASLGELTAGIAHEIKNPLNFVNNFSETSVELLDELKEVLEPVHGTLDQDAREDVDDIFVTLKGDLEKINHHGRRADNIVKSMLLHARGDASEPMLTQVNDLVQEAYNLAYHGERARDKSFQATLEQNFDDAAGQAELIPQEITRVLVNMFSNAFYAVKRRSMDAASSTYAPTVTVWTEDSGEDVQIRIRDNGTGMPEHVREKLFDPFFTTKPTGEGTGLGLSMSFDIIAQQHGGHIDVASKPGEFTEFTITLPRHSRGAQ